MKIRSFSYYTREALRNMIRNRMMTVASVLTVASCILIVSIFYCLAANIDHFLGELEGTIGIAVFVREDIPPDEVLLLSEKIIEIPHVSDAEYVSESDTLQEYLAILPDARIGAGLEQDNPFRRSFNIEVDDLRFQADVITALEALRPFGIDVIRHVQDTANIVLAISNMVRVVCIVLILILATISIVIITNTIRITVNARRSEITIMKYVGATDWFIRWPFAIEGILIGLTGGVIPSVVCVFGYNAVINAVQDTLPALGGINFMSGYSIFAYLIPFAVILGILIGVIGSFLSIRQHLKV